LGNTQQEREREKSERHLPTSWNTGTTRILVAFEEQGVGKKRRRRTKTTKEKP